MPKDTNVHLSMNASRPAAPAVATLLAALSAVLIGGCGTGGTEVGGGTSSPPIREVAGLGDADSGPVVVSGVTLYLGGGAPEANYQVLGYVSTLSRSARLDDAILAALAGRVAALGGDAATAIRRRLVPGSRDPGRLRTNVDGRILDPGSEPPLGDQFSWQATALLTD